MSDKYKVGLTRNRLFEFENTVVFCGKLLHFTPGQISAALGVLCLKEPLVTAVAELCENGECYIETERVKQTLALSDRTAEELKQQLSDDGICFTDGLFRFVFSADGYLLIGAHTMVADCKSLLRLAIMLAGLCDSGARSVLPSGVETFSDMMSLPVDVNSPLTDKLSAELDNGWQKAVRGFTVAEYKEAREIYREKRRFSREMKFTVGTERTAELEAFCGENKVDLSSVIAFAFYKALREELSPHKKHDKLCFGVDRRFFLACADEVSVGAFNGLCDVFLNEKERRLNLTEQIKRFHLSCYKVVTSPFRAFYDEVLLMKLSPGYCDSAHMYLAGVAKGKASRKLAENYGCMNERLCEFFSCNLEQEYWSGLKRYSDISVTEPLKNRFGAGVSLLMTDGACEITVKFNNSRVGEERCEALLDSVRNILNSVK